MGYKLFDLQLQVKFINVSDKFFSEMHLELVDSSGMGSNICVHGWGPPL